MIKIDISNELTGGSVCYCRMASRKELVFSIFSRGCKQYKSIHVNSEVKGKDKRIIRI